MELKEPVLKLLNKLYEPDCMIEIKFKRYDLAVKTDEAGDQYCSTWGSEMSRGV
jgi:hypothetical protein